MDVVSLQRALFCSIERRGRCIFPRGWPAHREKVPGVGIYSTDANGRGAATKIRKEADGSLLIIGQQGQIFRREGPGRWIDLAPTPPPIEMAGDIVNPTAAHIDGRGILLSGFIFPAQVPNPEALAARKAGDHQLYARLLRTGARLQHGCLYRLNAGTWQRIKLPTSVILYDMLSRPNEVILIAGGRGTILSFEDDEEIAVLGGDETTEEMVSLCAMADEVLASSEAGLFALPKMQFPVLPDPAVPLRPCCALWQLATCFGPSVLNGYVSARIDVGETLRSLNMLEVPFRR